MNLTKLKHDREVKLYKRERENLQKEFKVKQAHDIEELRRRVKMDKIMRKVFFHPICFYPRIDQFYRRTQEREGRA